MNGFDFKPPGNPFQMLTPEMLAQAAGAAFRPPQPMMMSGLNLQPSLPPMQQQAPSFDLRDGMALASEALKALGKRSPTIPGQEPQRTAGDADLGGYSKVGSGGMVDVGGGLMLPNPNRPDSYAQPDFLTGVWRKLFG